MMQNAVTSSQITLLKYSIFGIPGLPPLAVSYVLAGFLVFGFFSFSLLQNA